MKKAIYAIIISILASINLSVKNIWQAGLSLSPNSLIFKFLNEFIQPFTNINILMFICYFFITLFLLNYIEKNKTNIQIPLIARLLSELYVLILSICIDYNILNSTNLVNLYLYSPLRLVVLVMSIMGISLILFLSLNAIFLFVQIESSKIEIKSEISGFNYFKHFAIIFACWLPYIIVLYPGTRSPDIVNQLLEFFNHGSWVRDDYPIGWYLLGKAPFTISNQHNFFVTLLYGFNFKLGLNVFHSVGLGLFLSTLIQVLLMVAVLTYALLTFNRMRMPHRILKLFVAFFALCPMLPIISVFLTKNVLYTPATLWSILLMVNAFNNNELFNNIKWWILFVISLIGQLITEKYAVYIIVITAILIPIFGLREKAGIKLSLSMIGTVLIFSFAQSGMFKALNVPNGDPIEGQAVLIQSTALYVKEFPNDLTYQDRETINKVFVLKNLPKLYTPGLSDPVKSSGNKKIGLRKDGTFDQNIRGNWVEGYRYRTVTRKDIKNYKKTWVKLAFKHPEIVFVAFMNQGYQYIDITSNQGTSINGWSAPYNSINVSQFPTELDIRGKKVMIDYTGHFVKTRAVISTLFNIFDKVPPFSFLLNGNIYLFVSIIVFLILLAMKLYKESMLILSFLLQIPIFMLSPVNGSQRYMYPFFFGTIIFLGLAYCWISLNRSKNDKKGK